MERFYSKVDKTDTCWIWNAAGRGKSGYGAFKLNGKVVNAHRFSYTINKGEIPDKLFVCHTCDNRKCVNPEHLFLGTHSDNMKDAYKKGRLKLPEKSRFKNGHIPNSSILKTKEEVDSIKKMIKERKSTLKALSEELNLPYQLLKDINSNRVYK